MQRNMLITTFMTVGALACGGTEPDHGPDDAGIDPQLEAIVAAESASAISAASDVGIPVDARDRAEADVMDAVRNAYLRRMPCASVSRNGTVVAVDFGTGCTYDGHTVAGAFSVGLTQTSPIPVFTVTLDALTTDGITRNGRYTMSGSAGVLTLDLVLSVDDPPSSVDHLFSGTLAPDEMGLTLDGTAQMDDGTIARDVNFEDVFKAHGDCYPSAGRIVLDRTGQPTTTVTFLATTPVDGQVEVQIGRLVAVPATLPSCPR